MIIANHELLQLSHGFFFALLLTQLTFWNKPLAFQNTAKMIICTTTLTINKGESHLDIRSLVLQFSRRCPLSGSQNQRNWDSGNSETSKFLPKCRAGTLCIDYWNKANHHHPHHHPHTHRHFHHSSFPLYYDLSTGLVWLVLTWLTPVASIDVGFKSLFSFTWSTLVASINSCSNMAVISYGHTSQPFFIFSRGRQLTVPPQCNVKLRNVSFWRRNSHTWIFI